MSVQQLLTRLRDLDVKLWVEGDKLRYSAPQGVLTDELLNELAGCKKEMTDWLSKAVADSKLNLSEIMPASRSRDLPASYSQERLLFLEQLVPETNSYNLPLAVKLSGELNIEALEYSLNMIISRHESLRTRFTTSNGQHIQIVEPEQSIKVALVSVTDNLDIMRLVEMEKSLPFNLATGPLLRCKLFKISEHDHILVLTFHHIVCDAWSLGVFFKELGSFYNGYSDDEPVQLPKLDLQYADYAVWQRQQLSGEALEDLLGYWRDNLNGLTTLELPTDHPRPLVQSFEGRLITRALAQGIGAQLRRLSEQEEATLFMTLLAAFTILLHRYCGQDDIVVGTPTANRSRIEVEGIIGFFVNMLVLRTDMSANPSFRELLSRVKKAAMGAYQHQELPFEKLVRDLRTDRDLSRNPLFQVEFALQNAPLSSAQLKGLTIEPLQSEGGVTRFDLEVNLWEGGDGLFAVCSYNTNLFEASTIDRMLEHYQQLLVNIVENPDMPIDNLQLFTQEEQHLMLREWNHTATDYPRDKTVQELFEEQVAATPDAIALEYEGRELSYAQLNARANQVAHYLQTRGVGPEVMVGICVERSLEMVIGLLGILKAGGAYLPLDSDYPQTRLAFMLEDAGVPVLLTLSSLDDRLPAFAGERVCLDTDWTRIEQESTENPVSTATPDNLIYVIYTSGSTGRPKGTMIEHRSAVRLVRDTNYVELGADEVFLQFAPISFDASTFELWGSLLNGAKLVIFPAGSSSLEELGRFIQDKGITTLWLTSSLFSQMVDDHQSSLSGVRQLLAGGEALSLPQVRKVLEQLGEGRLINGYGPTENTTFTCCHVMTGLSQLGQSVPIGRPISNTTVYVLDKQMNPVPIGVPGELYIGGDGLARGYLNQPELTAEKFIANPFSDGSDERLYRTGDKVRYRSDGTIEFIGRFDHQVKIRGYRIELGEIEAILTDHEAVRDAVAIVREDEPGKKRLVAYVIAEDADQPAVADLREFVRERLPNYMLPSAFMVLDSFPLTANSKLDRNALPSPEIEHMAGETYIAPHNEIETRIAGIWCDLLGIEKSGTRDNFFDLGGHSLLMSQVQARLNDEFDRNIPMLDLFQYPTIKSLADHLSGEGGQTVGFARACARMDKHRGTIDDDEAIAVIAMAGRFPGAATIEQFWENLESGVESIRFFTDEELAAAGVPEQLVEDPRFIPAKGFLDDADLFDAAFFGYPPHEAELLDPQQRVFLECAWETLERAGYDPKRYQGLIGVYAGSSTNSYRLNLNSHPELARNFGMQVHINSDKDFLTTRVSYKLDLHGPSVTLQTACSTSLVAIHEACKSLLENECDIALAGGVSVLVPRVHGYLYQDESIMSVDGHCRAFSADARGTVSGEGVGIVALKRLAEAKQDGDLVHAVILGSAINNDGSNKVGFTAPSVEGQAEVIALAQAAAGVSADSIGYIETHGTGTRLGDPIEIAALARVFKESGKDNSNNCALGAIKSNIGHLDAAAGVTSLIKTVLTLKHNKIPPAINFVEPNPEIDFASGPFFVNTEPRSWQTEGDTPRRAGVSSFGIGGTNAHAVLEQAPVLEKSEPGREWQLLTVSAKNEVAAYKYSSRIADYLEQNPDANLADMSFTLRTGRGEFDYRRAVVCKDIETAVAGLRGEATGQLRTNKEVANSSPVIFMFPGQGSQYADMGRGLYENETVFRSIVDDCCEQLKIHIEIDLRDILFSRKAADPEQADKQLHQTLIAQCSLFVVEYALARLWMSWGLQPAAMIGHSIGEYVAACVSGSIDLGEALLLIAIRGQAMEKAPRGAMLSVPLPEKQVIPYLRHDLWLSVINGHSSCVVSGTSEAIDDLGERLRKDSVETLRLHTSGAFHSGLMDDVVPRLVKAADKLNISSPRIPYISNVTGTWVDESELQNPEYWGQHLRGIVRFAQGIDVLLEKFETGVFLEVGPGKTLSSMLRQNASDNSTRVEILSSLRYPGEKLTDGETVARALAGLWLGGASIDWQSYDQHGRRCRVELPTYPFQRQNYWVEHSGNHATASMTTARQVLKDWFYTPAWTSSRMLEDCRPHKLHGEWIVFANNSASCKSVIAYIERLGGHVIRVTAAGEFARLSPANFTINPSRKEDYEALFSNDELCTDQFQGIIHCWGINDAREDNVSVSTEVMQLEYYSLLYTSQALIAAWKNLSLHINVLTQYSQVVDQEEMLLPEKSMVTALLRVISQENIGFKFTVYDLLDDEIEARVKQAGRPDETPVEIQSILNSSQKNNQNRVIAFRRARRLLQTYDHISLDHTQPDQVPVHIREKGVYLITGGLGGVGFALANYLAREVGARLVLTARTPLPERSEWAHYLQQHDSSDKTRRIIVQIQNLEAIGADVLITSVDVSDLSGMQKLVDKAVSRYGRINGVIHAAGVVSGNSMRSMQSLTYEDCELQFIPKVHGLIVLKQLFDDYPLDFIMPVSSLSSVLGGLGFAAYSAANQYMDSFCQQQHNLGNTQWISVNWDGWLFDDMEENGVPQASTAQAAYASLSMTSDEGKNVFKQVLNSSYMPQVIVSTGNLDNRLMQWVFSQPDGTTNDVADDSRYERPELSDNFVEAGTQSEIRLSVIWKQLFKLTEVGIHDNFFELGGHSLLAIQAIAAIRKEFNTSLSIERFLELGTIEKTASHLDALEWARSDVAEKIENDDSREEFEL